MVVVVVKVVMVMVVMMPLRELDALLGGRRLGVDAQRRQDRQRVWNGLQQVGD